MHSTRPEHNDFHTPSGEDTTLVTASSQGEISAMEGAIMDACNALHAARAAGDHRGVIELAQVLGELLERYAATDGDNHPNPRWAIPTQRALALSAMGRTREAIEAELLALPHADTPRRLEISLGNLADRCMRIGLVDEALAYFMRAWAVAPDSVPIMLTGAQALFAAGMHSDANEIFANLLEMPELLAPDTELTAYLDHEPRLRAMADRLPSLAELMANWAAVAGPDTERCAATAQTKRGAM